MKNIKLVVIVLLSVLLLVVVLQNTEPVETRFLFASVTMPRAALLGLTGLVGFIIGVLTAMRVSVSREKQAASPSDASQD